MARNFTYFCLSAKDIGKATDVKGNSFTCEHCGQKLVYLAAEKRLGAHGKTKETVGHELRQVDEPLK